VPANVNNNIRREENTTYKESTNEKSIFLSNHNLFVYKNACEQSPPNFS